MIFLRPLILTILLLSSMSASADPLLIAPTSLERAEPQTKDNTFKINESPRDILTLQERQWLLDNPDIKIAGSGNWPPLAFTNQAGQLSGLNIELLTLINKHLNTKFSYQRYSLWSQALREVKTGQLGGIFSLSWSAEREQYIDYSPIYFHSPYALIVHQDRDDIYHLSDLNNKRIVSFKDVITNNLVKADNPNTTIVFTNTNEQAYRLVSIKSVDAYIQAFPNPKDLLKYKLKVVNSIYNQVGDFAIGTSKKHPMLGQILTKGLNAISINELAALRDKWQKNNGPNNIFTELENHYIANNPTVTVGVDQWAPIIYTEDNKVIKGIAGDLLTEISAISGLRFKLKTGPWHQQLAEFNKKNIDLLPTTYLTEPRKKYGLFSDSYFALASSIFVIDTNTTIKKLADLAGLKLAIVKSFSTIEIIKDKYPNITVVETNNNNESIAMLLNGEVDAIFEVDIVILAALKKGLIRGVKSVRQTEIAPQSLRLYSRIDRPILQSILSKALYSISQSKKYKIIERWLGNNHSPLSLNMAFGSGRAPYTLDKQQIEGLEYTLVERILKMSNITIKKTKKLSIPQLATALDDYSNLAAAVTIAKPNNDYFYSDPFITFNNVAISRKEDNLNITDVSMLRDHAVAAFADAYKHLGLGYFSLFNLDNRPESYREYRDQEQQVKRLLQGQTDVLVMDTVIFNWYATKAGFDLATLFDFHPIFPQATELVVGFREQNIRNVFNHNLAKIIKSGEYQHVVNEYVSSSIIKQTELTSLVASLTSKFIFEENLPALTSLVNMLSSLTFIDKIEVFDNSDNLIYRSSPQNYSFHKQADSYYLLSGAPKKVGQVHIYFNDRALKQLKTQSSLIPDITFYKEHSQYRYIWELYRQLDILEKKIYFTDQEKSYLLSHPVLTFSEINWQPLSIIKDNKMSGFIADHLAIITKKTGIEFKFVASSSFTDVLTLFSTHKIDIIPSITNANVLPNIGEVSDEYASFDFAIVMAGDASFIAGIKDLRDKTIALPSGYTSHQYISDNYSEIKIIETYDIKQALNLVRSGKADAFIGHLMASAYRLENDFLDLKIVGIIDFNFSHRILMHKDNPVLLSIINKALKSILPEQHQEIRNRWFKRSVKTAIDYRVIYQIVAVFLIILTIIFFVFKKLATSKRTIELTNIELERTIVDLNQAQQQLVESEKMASLGGLVAGIAHEINTPIGIGLTAISHFVDITQHLEEKYQQKRMSQQDFDGYLSSAIEVATIVNRNLERTAELVKSFKQISVDQSSDERRSFSVNQYINEILLSIHHLTKKSNIEIAIHCDESLVINSYPGAFAQIITNLLINSTIHGYPNNEQGQVAISVTLSAQSITLIYLDDGIGISPKNLPRIFEPFFTTNREQGGSGLGLNIIYNIVTNRLNGKIKCESKLGEQTKFIIEFETTVVGH